MLLLQKLEQDVFETLKLYLNKPFTQANTSQMKQAANDVMDRWVQMNCDPFDSNSYSFEFALTTGQGHRMTFEKYGVHVSQDPHDPTSLNWFLYFD